MKRRMFSAADVAATLQDAPREQTVRTRTTVTYDDYVLRYARAQRFNVLLAATGAAVVAGAVVYLSGAVVVILCALGIGLTLAGAAGMLVTAEAHADYTRYLALGTVLTTRREMEPETRVFRPSANGGRTVLAGAFSLPASAWAALYNAARNNGGRLTRDAAKQVIPRDLYYPWQTTLGELRRLGLVDDDGMVMDEAWREAGLPPYPGGGNGVSPAHRTDGRRTDGEE